MKRFKLYYSDHVEVPLPAEHRFPMEKYALLRQRLMASMPEAYEFIAAPLALREDLLRAHDPRFVDGYAEGTLPYKELRAIGLPWSRALYERSASGSGGFIRATESALADGFSALLAGGTHHSHHAHGEGYCVFNDFAVAALRLLDLGRVHRILILDLDVHQGNGNSSILGKRADVFVCSLHGERNYPFRKVPSHLDVPLPAGIGDEAYLAALEETLEKLQHVPADILLYQAGVDVLKEDSLGTFELSHEGVRQRDERVFRWAQARGLPVALAIGGGYAKPIHHTIDAHVGTFQTARALFSKPSP